MNDHKSNLLAKIAAKKAAVAVIGLGYVADAKKPEALHRGESYIKHISYIQKTTESIAAHARPGQLVVLESTTYPGTTREEIVPEHPIALVNELKIVFDPIRRGRLSL